jgi:hypothetical protein
MLSSTNDLVELRRTDRRRWQAPHLGAAVAASRSQAGRERALADRVRVFERMAEMLRFRSATTCGVTGAAPLPQPNCNDSIRAFAGPSCLHGSPSVSS